MPSKTAIAELPSTTIEVIDEPAKPKPSKSTNKTPATKPTPVATFETANSKLDLAERLLMRRADGEELEPHDFELFFELGWNKGEIEKQTRRVANIAKLQRVAGTKSALVAKKEKLKTTSSDSNEKIEILDAQIQAAMDERDKIATGVRQLETGIAASELAVEELRTKVPGHRRRVRDQLVGQLKASELNKEKLELENKVAALEGLPTNWNTNDHACIKAVLAGTPESERPAEMLDGRGRVHLTKWAEFSKAKKSELPELVRQLEKLEIKYERRMAEADELLDFYLA